MSETWTLLTRDILPATQRPFGSPPMTRNRGLIRAEQLSVAGRLPPVLPVVLYNGANAWTAAETLEPLIEPAPSILEAYRPRQGYLLLDEQRIANTGALPERNLSAALLRLEASRGSAAAMGIVRALIDWLQAPEQLGLRRAFAIWFGRVFLPKRLPGVELPPLSGLSEVYSDAGRKS